MNPKLCIAMDHADSGDPKNRFPTAATCMNMLRLPKYRNKQDLKRTLDYVINANQGFGLGWKVYYNNKLLWNWRL